jgi:hypothetical protein
MERIATPEGSATSLKRRWALGYLNQEIYDPIVFPPDIERCYFEIGERHASEGGRAFRLVLGNLS